MNTSNFCHKALVFLILTSSVWDINVKAENSRINWGEPQESKKYLFIRDIDIFKKEDQFIYYYGYYSNVMDEQENTIHQRSYSITKTNIKNGQKTEIEIKLKVKDRELKVINHFYIDNTFHLFTYFHNKKDKKLYVFHETYNLEKMISNNDMNIFSEIDLNIKGGWILDESTVIIKYMNGHYLFRYGCKSTKGNYFGMEVYDKSLKKEWTNNSMADSEKGYVVESDYQIDRSGNVYAIQRTFEKENDHINHYITKARIWIVCYKKGGEKSTSTAIVLKNDNIITSRPLIGINDKDEIICAGLYSKPATTSPVGCFSFVLNPQLSGIKTVSTKELPLSMILKGENSQDLKYIEKQYNQNRDYEDECRYRTDSIHFRKDGGFDLLFEKFKTYKGNDDGYCYDALVLFNCDISGNINWAQKICKTSFIPTGVQWTFDSYLSGSYLLTYDNENNIRIIFNAINSGPKDSKCFDKKAQTMQVVVNKNGNEASSVIENNPLFANKTCPSLSKSFNNSLILLKYNLLAESSAFNMSKNYSITFGEYPIK